MKTHHATAAQARPAIPPAVTATATTASVKQAAGFASLVQALADQDQPDHPSDGTADQNSESPAHPEGPRPAATQTTTVRPAKTDRKSTQADGDGATKSTTTASTHNGATDGTDPAASQNLAAAPAVIAAAVAGTADAQSGSTPSGSPISGSNSSGSTPTGGSAAVAAATTAGQPTAQTTAAAAAATAGSSTPDEADQAADPARTAAGPQGATGKPDAITAAATALGSPLPTVAPTKIGDSRPASARSHKPAEVDPKHVVPVAPTLVASSAPVANLPTLEGAAQKAAAASHSEAQRSAGSTSGSSSSSNNDTDSTNTSNTADASQTPTPDATLAAAPPQQPANTDPTAAAGPAIAGVSGYAPSGDGTAQAAPSPDRLTLVSRSSPLAASAVAQVQVTMLKAGLSRAGAVTVRLDPAELGRVEIKLKMEKDAPVHAVITADRPQTLDMLRGDRGTLERALQSAGLSTDPGSLSFNLRDQSQQQQASTGFGGGQTNRQFGTDTESDPANTQTLQLVAVSGAAAGRLDLRV